MGFVEGVIVGNFQSSCVVGKRSSISRKWVSTNSRRIRHRDVQTRRVPLVLLDMY